MSPRIGFVLARAFFLGFTAFFGGTFLVLGRGLFAEHPIMTVASLPFHAMFLFLSYGMLRNLRSDWQALARLPEREILISLDRTWDEASEYRPLASNAEETERERSLALQFAMMAAALSETGTWSPPWRVEEVESALVHLRESDASTFARFVLDRTSEEIADGGDQPRLPDALRDYVRVDWPTEALDRWREALAAPFAAYERIRGEVRRRLSGRPGQQ